MEFTMLDKRLEVIFFYMRNKRYAVSRLKTFIPPLDDMRLAEMQVAYGLYFNSLISVIDYINKDLAQAKIVNDLITIVGGEENYGYIRELRNSIIHRGLDVSSAGTAIENLNIIVPFSPYYVQNQSGNKKYYPFTNNLLQLVKKTESINLFIFNICKQLQITEYKPMTKESYKLRIINDPYMPDDVKRMALKTTMNFDKINQELEQIHNQRLKTYFNTEDLL